MRTIPFDEAITLIESAPVRLYEADFDGGCAKIILDEDDEVPCLIIEEDVEYPALTYIVNAEKNAQVKVENNCLNFVLDNDKTINIFLYKPLNID